MNQIGVLGQILDTAEAAAKALARRTKFNLAQFDTEWNIGLTVRKERPFSCWPSSGHPRPKTALEGALHVAGASPSASSQSPICRVPRRE